MDVLVLPGDGIGPEISAATLTVLDRVNDRFELGLRAYNRGEFAEAAFPIFEFLYRAWWRVKVEGMRNVPGHGA